MRFNNSILVVAGEPNSIFIEIFIKSLNKTKFKNPLILIASYKLIKLQMKKLNLRKKIKILNYSNLLNYKLNNNFINLINVDYNQINGFEKITNKSQKYIKECFKISFKIIKKNKLKKFINGPISKKNFFNKNFLGMTEYISKEFKIMNSAMLIYNKELAVCPITTHLPLKAVAKTINKKLIIDKVKVINKFYNIKLYKKPKIGVLGLNPHCESIDKFNEDEKIIKPAIKFLKNKKYNISGPYPADTIFMKKNRKKFDVIVGMYHDQVLTPLKSLYEYDAINITVGLPFIRISPDHGPNETMMGKNISNPLSLIKAIKFLDKN